MHPNWQQARDKSILLLANLGSLANALNTTFALKRKSLGWHQPLNVLASVNIANFAKTNSVSIALRIYESEKKVAG